MDSNNVDLETIAMMCKSIEDWCKANQTLIDELESQQNKTELSAVLFKELNLLNKTHIVATDVSNKALESAKKGIYSTEKMQQYSANYQHAGGLTSLNYYFTSLYEWVKISDEIMKYINFQQHNLLTNKALNKKHLISCRNVLIYFSDTTQELVFKLLSESLVKQGLLLLGPQDNLHSATLASDFEVINETAQLYRKK